MSKKKILYITETSLPSSSANIINSLKFCDALANFHEILFFVPQKKISNNKIYRNYNLKNKFTFKSITKKKLINRFNKIFFYYNILKFILFSKEEYIFLSRSILSSIILSFFNKKNTLEIHHTLSGISKLMFRILMNTPYKKNLNLILINKNLVKDLNVFNMNYIILDDASDKTHPLKDRKYFKNTCVYIGSFYKGKSIELLVKLADKMPNINFHLYGDFSVLKKRGFKNFKKNIKLMRRLHFFEVSKILKKYHIALMPFENTILGKSKNLEISKYISPLKMFDYLSVGNIVIASKLQAYNHILKNNFNSFLISNKNIYEWKKRIIKIFKRPNKYKKIKLKAINTAKVYSWDNRAKKYINFIKN